MNTKSIVAALAAASGVLVSGLANAQTAPVKDEANGGDAERSRELAPATHALELTVGTGYQQGFGKIASDRATLTDVANAGGAVQIGVGYRLIPQLTLGVYGSGAAFGRGDAVDPSANLYSAAAGVQADWHFLPSGNSWDPWLSLGTGWRGYWVSADQGTTSLHGLELAKLQLGVDYRIDQAVSISPVIGADLSTFLTQKAPGASGFSNVESPNVNTFVFAGVQGRFDIPTESRAPKVASR